MKAMVLRGPKEPFVLEDRPDPAPGPGEAVARVLACGSGLTIQHVRAGRTDYQIASPARELLTTTRLLQGSQAIRDQRLRELLDELELVLVQIAQLRPDLDGEDAELVTQAIEQRSVLLRLRAAADAAPEISGVQGVI